jgi:hypothetical protein
MTARRRRILLSADEAKALAEERKQTATRRAADAIANRLPRDVLLGLIRDLVTVGELPSLVMALRKRAKTQPAPDVVGEPRPDKTLWDDRVAGKSSGER